ncbi:hypothetical protein ABEW81_11140 [Priestia megaterium]
MNGKRWTPEEIEFLEKHVGKMMLSTLAKRISEKFGTERTGQAVSKKIWKLGIGNTKVESGRITANGLAHVIQVQHKTITRWIESGKLKSVKRAVRFEKKMHLISVKDFWEFAEQHKDRINFSKIEPKSLVPEPEWVEEERKKDFHNIKKQYRHWTEEEEKKLVSMIKSGYSYKEIAKELKRGESSVIKKRDRLKAEGVEVPDQLITIPWKEEELQLMLQLEKQGYTDAQIAYELGREAIHVQNKRIRLRRAGKYQGLKKRGNIKNVS